MMDAASEAQMAGMHRFEPNQQSPDLSNGGTLNGVTVRPTREKARRGEPPRKGRPNARQAWSFNGTETVLALAWNPEGTMHDAGRRYLLKRHCLCCGLSGFRGRTCPNCVKTNCDKCGSSSVPKNIIPNFYLRKDDVPFQEKFYGDVDCFMPFCQRRGGKGFKTKQDMRVHAASRHRSEYRAFLETEQASRTDDVSALQKRVDDLTSLLLRQAMPVPQAVVTAAPVQATIPPLVVAASPMPSRGMITCACGATYEQSKKYTHRRSKAHKAWVQAQAAKNVTIH